MASARSVTHVDGDARSALEKRATARSSPRAAPVTMATIGEILVAWGLIQWVFAWRAEYGQAG
jgi:hypothetical protein